MTETAHTPRLIVAGNGTRGPFTLSVSGSPITFAAQSELVLKRYDSAGVLEGTLVLNTDYQISATAVETGDAAATFTLESTEDVLASGEKILVERVTPKSSSFALSSTGGIFEAALDKQTRIVQELATAITRRVEVDPLYTGSAALPAPEAGAFLGWNASANALQNYEGVTDVGVSPAMAPVVQAASLSLGRTAFGVPGLADANTFTSTNAFRGRVTIDPEFAVWDQAAGALASMLYFGAATITVADNKRLDLIRSDNTFTVGNGGVARYINANIIASASCHASSDVRGPTTLIQNAGPGTVTAAYFRAEGLAGGTGPVFALKMGVKTVTGIGTTVARQVTNDTDSGTSTYAFDWWTSNTASATTSTYGLIADSLCSFGTSFIQAYAVGAGNAFTWKNSTGSADLLILTAAGGGRFAAAVSPMTSDGAALGATTAMWSDLFLASGAVVNFNNGNFTLTHSAGLLTANGAITATTVTGSTSLIAASSTNGITITQSLISRNAAAGSMTIAAGTNAGNALAFQTGNSTRLGINDSLITTNVPLNVLSGTAIPAGGTAGSGMRISSTTNFGVFFGSGAPTLSAAKGSIYLRSDGSGTSDRCYCNTDGGTTWTAFTTAA